jgi:multiple sugar transport system substrate-binding protein
MRNNIAVISSIGRNLPHTVPRQHAVQLSLSEELITMQLSKKPVAQVQEAAETRVNKLLDSVR